MATSCLRSTFLLKKIVLQETVCQLSSPGAFNTNRLYPVAFGQLLSVRCGSFFNRQRADDLWKSNTTVSNAGRRRGRAGRGKLMQRENFSRGKIGVGQSGLQFPGLTGLISVESGTRQKMHFDESKKAKAPEIIKITKKRMFKTDPLNRGYTGRSRAGKIQSLPEPVDGYVFEGFKSVVLKQTSVGTVTAAQGSLLSPYAIVAVGNTKGLIGVAAAKGSSYLAAINTAKKKASKRLVYVERFDDHTIHHNFTETYLNTKVIAYGKQPGYGLVCHRVIKTLCDLIGIKNIYVKTEGNAKNYLAVSRAFIEGLLKQRSLQQIADETGHHVVEYREEKENYPVIVASPKKEPGDTKAQTFEKGHFFDFESYCFGGKTLYKKKKEPKYAKLKSYQLRLKQDLQRDKQLHSKMQRMVLNLEKEYKR